MTQDAHPNPAAAARQMALLPLIAQVEAMVEEGGDPEGFDAARWLADWLNRPNPALGHKPPAEFLDTVEGQQLVSQLLSMMRSGAFA